ncbi:MAG: RluA family pseudouridine synthase [Bacteroidetes bacterium]|nr:RluA family pseudouridine synthase [Bacteroidota bacterium]
MSNIDQELAQKHGLNVLFEDNHILVLNKQSSDISQGDITGDKSLPEKIMGYWKEKYQKPGKVYCGVVHRLDRPTSGVIIYTKTSKALERLFVQFKAKTIKKTYWAVIEGKPPKEKDTLVHFMIRKEKINKSFANDIELKGSKKAILHYQYQAGSNNYHLLSVNLETGRHHQIRSQLSTIGCHIKGDVKYGARRSNEDLSIHLHARTIEFEHPVTKEVIAITAPVPKEDNLWQFFEKEMEKKS